MDPISGIASVLTLTASAATVVRTILKIFREVKHAPQELQRLSCRVALLCDTLEQQLRFQQSFGRIDLGSVARLLSTKDIDALSRGLKQVEESLGIVQKSLGSYKGKPNATRRLQWVIRDRRLLLHLVDHVHQIEQILSTMLISISTSVQQDFCLTITI